jgi:hypothetical protein
MSVSDAQPIARGKIAKGETERRIIAALPPRHRLVRINWKKGIKLHIVDGFGKRSIITLSRTVQ